MHRCVSSQRCAAHAHCACSILLLILQTNALNAFLVIVTLYVLRSASVSGLSLPERPSIVNLAHPPAYELVPRLIPTCYFCSLLINLTSRREEDVAIPGPVETIVLQPADQSKLGRTSRTFGSPQLNSFIGQIEVTTECETKVDGP